ncbi:MAG TPA: hybrid sensor histidine kinase/response regulator [Bryobacteraceae bacterium]|nr:hybrid sensor histidine kinase/response regulator [Bryobacteraceae bacterium]
MEKPGKIMIVDDSPSNLELLEDVLREQGHEVRSFPLGRLALEAALRNPPDLILLDVNMPEISGYEVCERLKATDQLADIPVIFLSALKDARDKVKAFGSGAVDYISKPFRIEEVRARVETHLQLHSLQRALKLQNEFLEQAVDARALELGEANRQLTVLDRSKNEFLNLISHEFRTPLHGLLGAGALILEGMPATKENRELQEIFERSRRRMLSILDDALLLTQIDVNEEHIRSAPVPLRTVLARATERAAALAESRGVAVPAPPAAPGLVLGDEELLTRALHALLETAVKFSEKGGAVQISRPSSQDGVPQAQKVVIESCGRTIPDQALPKFFDLLSIGEAITPGGDLGLGPPMAYRIFLLFGGSVSVANRNPAGIRLTVSLRDAASV